MTDVSVHESGFGSSELSTEYIFINEQMYPNEHL